MIKDYSSMQSSGGGAKADTRDMEGPLFMCSQKLTFNLTSALYPARYHLGYISHAKAAEPGSPYALCTRHHQTSRAAVTDRETSNRYTWSKPALSAEQSGQNAPWGQIHRLSTGTIPRHSTRSIHKTSCVLAPLKSSSDSTESDRLDHSGLLRLVRVELRPNGSKERFLGTANAQDLR